MILSNILHRDARLLHQFVYETRLLLLSLELLTADSSSRFCYATGTSYDAIFIAENSLHKFQAVRCRLHRRWKVLKRANGGGAGGSSSVGGSPINHSLTNCRTERFARNIGSARSAGPCGVLAGRFTPARCLRVDYARRIPRDGEVVRRDLRGRRKRTSQGNGGIRVFIRGPRRG